MEQKIVGYIPKLLFKLYLSLKDKFDPRPPITHEEQYSVDICKKLIVNESSHLTLAPKSFKRFIRNEDYDMFIVIQGRTINLINHVYSYSVYIESEELYGGLIEQFDMELERRREELESQITNNIQHSLQNILNKLN
jgi:hypothetical protein